MSVGRAFFRQTFLYLSVLRNKGALKVAVKLLQVYVCAYQFTGELLFILVGNSWIYAVGNSWDKSVSFSVCECFLRFKMVTVLVILLIFQNIFTKIESTALEPLVNCYMHTVTSVCYCRMFTQFAR